jgi:REP element-mobilizing transposase RayT
MTAPRQILPGTTYLVTRRCSERRFFLRPSKNTNAIFGYLLALAASRYEIRVHAYCVLSNHFHLVVTDPAARLPDFHRYLDGLVARATNAALGRWESFWDPSSYSAVRLETESAVLEKIVYVLANPVAAGLVRRGREWPGLWSDPDRIQGAPVSFDRPDGFFRGKGLMPPSAELRLEPPPGRDGDAGFRDRVVSALREEEDRIAGERCTSGRTFLGASRAIAQKPFARPGPDEPRRNPNPRVASRDKCARIEALAHLAKFGHAYREALARWRAGVRDVVFPHGTWLMRVRHAVCCAAPG